MSEVNGVPVRGCGLGVEIIHEMRGICPDCHKMRRYFGTFTIPIGDCDNFAQVTLPRPMTEAEWAKMLEYFAVVKDGLVYEPTVKATTHEIRP